MHPHACAKEMPRGGTWVGLGSQAAINQCVQQGESGGRKKRHRELPKPCSLHRLVTIHPSAAAVCQSNFTAEAHQSQQHTQLEVQPRNCNPPLTKCTMQVLYHKLNYKLAKQQPLPHSHSPLVPFNININPETKRKRKHCALYTSGSLATSRGTLSSNNLQLRNNS